MKKIDVTKGTLEELIRDRIIETKGLGAIAYVKNVASSGMSRQAHFYYIDKHSTARCLDYLMRDIGYKLSNNNNAVILHGCGTDLLYDALINLYLALGIDSNDAYKFAGNYQHI